MTGFPPGALRPPARRSVLVTGFGGFPGAPRNPTERIVAVLAREAPRFARLGIELRCAVLPVRYEGLEGRLAALAAAHRPDAWLLLGVAGRRRRLCIEALARNRAAPLRPDAAGRCPTPTLSAGGAMMLPATLPCRRVLSALAAAGLPTQPSRDAGDYLCNAALYFALAAPLASFAGFLHVPQPIAPQSGRSLRSSPAGRGVTFAELVRAARLALLASAPTVHHVARKPKLGSSQSQPHTLS